MSYNIYDMPLSRSELDNSKREIASIDCGDLLARTVRNLILSKRVDLWEGGQRRGRVDKRGIWKASKQAGYRQEVFKKRVPQIKTNAAVTVLTDNSGSMSGVKFHHAAKAGLVLNRAFAKANVPIELLSFSDAGSPIHLVVKGFNDTRVSEDVLLERYAISGEMLFQNSDGESIEWAFSRLIKRQEERKVLIVLSDGQPSCSAMGRGDYGCEVSYTRKVVKYIEDETPVEIYGIGIMDVGVKQFYKNHKVIDSASQLEEALIELIKSRVL